MEAQTDETIREQARSLIQEASAAVKVFRTNKDKAEIDRGIKCSGEAFQLLPRGSEKWLDYLDLHAYYLEVRYQNFRDVNDLTTAIQLGNDWLTEADPNHEERSMVYNDLGDRWLFLSERNGDRASLDKALSCANLAYGVTPINMKFHQTTLRLLVKCYKGLHARFPEKDSYVKFLHATEQAHETAVKNQNSNSWNDMAEVVLAHIQHWHQAHDLEDGRKGLPRVKHFVKVIPHDMPDKCIGFRYIEEVMVASYKARIEPISTLEETLSILKDGLVICTTPSDRAVVMTSLIIVHQIRFQVADTDLSEAEKMLHYSRQTMQLTTPEDPDYLIRIRNLAVAIRTTYGLTGDVVLLDEAIQTLRVALAADDAGSITQAATSSTLSSYLLDRYEVIRSIDDLDEAVARSRDAVACEKVTSEEHDKYVQTLGAVVGKHAEVTRNLVESDESLEIAQRLLEKATTIEGQNSFRHNISCSLFDRYILTGNMDDWNECLSLARQNYEATSRDNVYDFARRSLYLSNRVYEKYTRNRSDTNLEPLEESIRLITESVHLLPRTHADWAEAAQMLSGRQLEWYRYHPKDSPEYTKCVHEAIATSTPVFDSHAFPMQRLRAGDVLLIALRAVRDWQRLNVVGKEMLELLSKINTRYLSRRDMQTNLKGWSATSSQIAINALKAGESPSVAFSMLETGHGLISDMVLSKRSDVALLELLDAELGSEYQSLLSALSAPSPAQFANVDVVKARQEALRQVLEVEDRIRKIPGLERFQIPPSTEELHQLAEAGPLVTFNVDLEGSVAFVITKEKIEAVPLPTLFRYNVENVIELMIGPKRMTKCSIMQRNEHNKAMKIVLKWLWEVAVKPVVDHLGFEGKTDPKELPRVWWITNGLIGLLPMHAAGLDWDRSFENTASRCVSTYISTTKALARARQKSQRLASGLSSTRCVAVEVPHTPEKGWPDLKTTVEMEQIRVQGEKHHVPVEVHTEPTVQELLDSLSDFMPAENTTSHRRTKTLLHLACHGDPNDTDPSRTALLLCNSDKTAVERLSVARLFELNQDNAYLAYLSACCTAQQYSKDLIDEGMHLANLFQISGFSHVVGTLWEADDSSAGSLAGMFYRRLFEAMQKQDADDNLSGAMKNMMVSTNGSECSPQTRHEWEQHDIVARCLHESLIELRAKKLGRGKVARDDVISWAGFINLGA